MDAISCGCAYYRFWFSYGIDLMIEYLGGTNMAVAIMVSKEKASLHLLRLHIYEHI